jgi:CubicO group peptidase (beta-lactamase class C family)
MKRILQAALLVAVATNAYAQPAKTKLDSLMNYYREEQGFNGVAFVSYKGETMLAGGYGYKDMAKKEKNDENTIFQMGSNTKQFTAEIILQLARQKKLDLKDKLTKYFPDYPRGEKVTMENLLTHTSGIYNYTNDSAWRAADPTRPLGRMELIAIFRDRPYSFEPGEKYEYSNSNYILLGYIIEEVTHRKYEAVVRENILKPCGMTHSGFDFTNLKDKNKATGYFSINKDKFETAPVADSTVSFAAGALYSTIGDMNKWHKALQSHKLLPKEWQDKAYVPFKKKYAYGWIIDTVKGHRIIGHGGGIHGFVSYEMRVEEDDVDIVLLQNNMAAHDANSPIAINILNCLYDKNYEVPKLVKQANVSQETMKQYEGDYALAPSFIINIKLKENELYAQATGQQAFQILPISETMFYTRMVDAKIEFVKDADGKVSTLILHQNGRDMPGKRQ